MITNQNIVGSNPTGYHLLKTIKIAIQKGRILEILKKKLCRIGFEFNAKNRKLTLKSKDKKKEICFARPEDIKIVFKKRISDFFIMGLDTYLENKLDYKFIKLKSFRCDLSLIKRKKKECKKKILYTKYPNILVKKNKYKKYKIIKVNGCLELYLKKRACKYILDIVDTGKTVKSNDLLIKRKIKTIYIVIVINRNVKKYKVKNILKYLR
ncbi:ATP phosphoribosyltransferase [Candidatus Vidania fulgoroideae]|nr:ATP phosphoribosyltransferase [Candidatus Vidania fulgoroideae]